MSIAQLAGSQWLTMEIDKLSIRIMWKGSQWLTHHNNFNDNNNNFQGLSDWLRELPHPRVHGVDHLPPVSQHHSHSKGLICFSNCSIHQNYDIEKTNDVNYLPPMSQHHFHFKGELKVFSKYMYDHWKGSATVAFLFVHMENVIVMIPGQGSVGSEGVARDDEGWGGEPGRASGDEEGQWEWEIFWNDLYWPVSFDGNEFCWIVIFTILAFNILNDCIFLETF